ncbi:hypothetical protein HOY80DRAFT_286385 [Tuber brumale]|nr:hypothetical protein HOY80DRAFT_286385 [Tuber brumale]
MGIKDQGRNRILQLAKVPYHHHQHRGNSSDSACHFLDSCWTTSKLPFVALPIAYFWWLPYWQWDKETKGVELICERRFQSAIRLSGSIRPLGQVSRWKRRKHCVPIACTLALGGCLFTAEDPTQNSRLLLEVSEWKKWFCVGWRKFRAILSSFLLFIPSRFMRSDVVVPSVIAFVLVGPGIQII